MKVNSVVGAAMVCFGGVFAVVVGYRIDQQTLIILTGVATGFVIAAIAVGLIAFFVIRQNRQPAQRETVQYHVAPAPTGPALPPPVVTYELPPPRPARQFVVIGSDGEQVCSDGNHRVSLGVNTR